MNNLTQKEVGYVSELLTYEGQAVKKAMLFSRTLTDPALADCMKKVAENHKKRFNALLDLL